jgi:hypothetical protein
MREGARAADADPGASRPRWRMGDLVQAFLVLVLAFLAGSFLAGNSDLWFHLGTGRLLADGWLPSGEDPFAYTTSDRYWACHSWLFDLALYHLYRLVGGAGLVVLKALLVSALAGLLLLVRRRDGRAGWITTACTALAVVAMSPRLQLQPVCVSYFLLGLTFWLLWRPHAEKDEGGRMKDELRQKPGGGLFSFILHPSSFILLAFVVWVNVDEWFLLGPLLAALFWLGERLGGRRRTPGWLVVAGLAVCLVNPNTWHAFTLPADLSPVTWTSGLRQDARFEALFASPWQSAYRRAALDLNAAVLAYFVLTFLGLLSFLVQRRALRDWRLVVWLALAVLAGWQARAIPFFAVVAAPITALNWQDFLAEHRGAGSLAPAARLASLGGRLLLSACLLGLILLTWFGWLAGRTRAARPVGWDVLADPSLRRVSETLHEWRTQGLLAGDERVFSLSPEVARYGAWFSPGERHFFDHRYPLFPGTARDYLDVCHALQPGVEGPPPENDWREVLRRHRVAVVVLYDRDPRRLLAAFHRLASEPKEWTLLGVPGQAVIFGWNQARPPGGFRSLTFDADRLAFGPADERSQRELPSAPGEGPKRPPPAPFWARLQSPSPQPSWESSAATVYLHYFHDTEAREQQQQLSRSLRAFAAGLAGLPAQRAGATLVALPLFSSRHLLRAVADPSSPFLARDQLGPFFRHLADRPPTLPLLAVRAARRAVAANPSDSNAWLRLGQAYLLLRNATCERSAEGLLPPLARLRFIQAVTALERAVQLDPDLEAAHSELGYLYGESALDMALAHRRAEVRITRRAGVRARETADEWAHRVELLERDVAKLEEAIRNRRGKYEAAARSLQGKRVEQAQAALYLGLARHAADDILLPCPADLLGPYGIKLELELLLSLGRADEVGDTLSHETMIASKHALPPADIPGPRRQDGGLRYALPYSLPGYEWLRVLQAAAVGDYDLARRVLRELRAPLRAGSERLKQQRQTLLQGGPQMVGGLFAGQSPPLSLLPVKLLAAWDQQQAALAAGERSLRAQQADLCVLEGLLALEQGASADARSAFLEAQGLGAGTDFAAAPIVGGYLPRLRAFAPVR